MSSLSDVRAVLHGQEMAAPQYRVRVTAGMPPDMPPEGFSRWQWFWHSLRTRRQLSALTAEQLRDIGLSAEQARDESLKAFWQR